jgi:predicted PurR-regulated permease PerM
MVFILGFVPVLGFIFSSIPLLIVGYNFGGHSVVLMLAIMIAVVHSVEAYYLNPKIVSSYMEFPVFVTFLILLVSEHVFGFVGLLIGVPLFYILVDVAKDLDVFVNKVKRVSNTIDTTKTSTKDAIHKNIRLSRSQGQEE